jgi:hypothetical protein
MDDGETQNLPDDVEDETEPDSDEESEQVCLEWQYGSTAWSLWCSQFPFVQTVAKLIVVRVGKEKKRDEFVLINGENTVGRKKENQVTLDYAW